MDELARRTFGYFDRYADATTGLVRDISHEDSPASIAACGMALGCYSVASACGYMQRAEAARRSATMLSFLWNADDGGAPDGTSMHGFFYHFLDVRTGRRAEGCEISTIDSAILFAGALSAACYFDRDDPIEREIRELADALYRRADWTWASPRPPAIGHGWTPERGFLRYDWCGYNEALLLYILALGSPTHPVSTEAYEAWTSSYKWKRLYGLDLLYAGPFFEHLLPHMWIDFRGIRDNFMRAHDCDYFENSRRAMHVQREYARTNPKGWTGYSESCWGVTASEGPGPCERTIHGVKRRFYDYHARGVPFGADDGTLSPWAVAAALPFAPDVVKQTLGFMSATYPEIEGEHGYLSTFNPTFPVREGERKPWVSSRYFGIDQGPVVMMSENHASEHTWQLMRGCQYVVRGLTRAGFSGGWLDRA